MCSKTNHRIRFSKIILNVHRTDDFDSQIKRNNYLGRKNEASD